MSVVRRVAILQQLQGGLYDDVIFDKLSFTAGLFIAFTVFANVDE